MEQFELDLGVPIDKSKTHDNPMVKTHGFGPTDKRCKHCKHLFSKSFYPNKYYKCGLRINTNGPGTDHRVNWATCSKFKGE